jgi:hypothetical protein
VGTLPTADRLFLWTGSRKSGGPEDCSNEFNSRSAAAWDHATSRTSSLFRTKLGHSGSGALRSSTSTRLWLTGQVAAKMQASCYLSQRNFDNIRYIPSAADRIRAMQSAHFCNPAISACLENSGSRNCYPPELPRPPQRIPPTPHSRDED